MRTTKGAINDNLDNFRERVFARLGRKVRLAYLVTHPIQYQAPLLRLISGHPDIDLTVFFQSDLSIGSYYDPGFERTIEWDVPLLDGYRSEFLPALGSRDRLTAIKPFNYGMSGRLRRGMFDVLWVHGYARFAHWAPMIAACAASVPVLVRDEAHATSSSRSLPKRILKRLFFAMLSLVCYGFLPIGTLNRNYYINNGVKPERLFLMPYCVDNHYFAQKAKVASRDREAFRHELGLVPDRPIILYASKFLRRKRPGDLLSAFENVVRAHSGKDVPYLVLVGDGDLRPELERRSQPINDHLKFTGFRNQSELPAFFDLCDLFVLPSEDEPWGLVVNEVMSVGRAVIVSDRVGCAPDLVKDGVNGYIYPVGDVAALGEAIARALESRDRLIAMGKASAGIIANWSYEQDVGGLLAGISAALRFKEMR